mmetsp:Transcript_1554/g.2998  ORF Transcript_1554/g.2998 Transcript_1554/m.2998 type:complete len:210 (-) Transcript_1554:30-659(-)
MLGSPRLSEAGTEIPYDVSVCFLAFTGKYEAVTGYPFISWGSSHCFLFLPLSSKSSKRPNHAHGSAMPQIWMRIQNGNVEIIEKRSLIDAIADHGEGTILPFSECGAKLTYIGLCGARPPQQVDVRLVSHGRRIESGHFPERGGCIHDGMVFIEKVGDDKGILLGTRHDLPEKHPVVLVKLTPQAENPSFFIHHLVDRHITHTRDLPTT